MKFRRSEKELNKVLEEVTDYQGVYDTLIWYVKDRYKSDQCNIRLLNGASVTEEDLNVMFASGLLGEYVITPSGIYYNGVLGENIFNSFQEFKEWINAKQRFFHEFFKTHSFYTNERVMDKRLCAILHRTVNRDGTIYWNFQGEDRFFWLGECYIATGLVEEVLDIEYKISEAIEEENA